MKRLLLLLLFLLLASDLFALIPDRRRLFEDREENVYMLIPAIASLPGLGLFAGVLGSFSNIGGSGIDAAVTEANTFGSQSDIHIRAYALREVPLFINGLTVEYWFGDIKFADFYTYLPGRDSPDFVIPQTGKFKYYFLRPAYRLWQRRINLTYNLVFFKGFGVNGEGEEALAASHSASLDFLLDLTDDWVDPRRGIRMGYSQKLPAPTKSVLGKNSENSIQGYDQELTSKSYNLGLYIPFGNQATLALYEERFLTTGGEDSGQVVSGGSLRLRGYPAGRWSDRFGDTKIAEFRYNIPINYQIDSIFAKGRLDDLQWALFYEEGQVSPLNDRQLKENLHQSSGVGLRALIDAIVLRLDVATSEAGFQTHLTIDHAF
ncbi:MAG: hypothetical protein A2527_13245 [Candidatus Lambdaproteobacteria bacterium RIFOXYD2_FULL_50_16]|uniref:Bacterial surface antigen (D15) domain-containing protein n=1 Tax=Candidatus Lambdaproteobacteria bacterium RIFOXYD2_FULL_50_16 TaxID=1817772 RepID=A0A1F6GG70_9PROT|nr:MAG: hypothetical protein A2527_13245 [Candidatus Lambdaproteobacteria bacterium RIFOXYD2_FULL_50_16]